MSGDFEQAKSRVCQSEGAYVSVRPLASSWEQRKFSDVAVIRRGLTYSPTNIVDGADGVRVLRSSNINEDHFVLNDDDVFVDESAVNIDLVHDGDILITAANGSPRLVGKRARISDLPGKTVHGGFMLVASSPCSDFLCASMGSSWYRRFLATGVAGGNGAIGNLDSKALGETIIAVPNDAEIDKLGNFFTRLDSLITLHQRKCQYRSLYGYLSWEQRKLGSIAASFDYGLNAAATEYDGQNKYLRITDIDDTTHEFLKSDLTTPLADLAMSADYLLEEGDLLFARTGASVGKTYLYRQYDGTVYFAGFLIRARIGESADPEFVYQATLTDAYKKYVAITSQRSGQPGVNAQEYADYQLMLPSRTEQQQIGMTLRSLDNLITLHQREPPHTMKEGKNVDQHQ